MFILINELETKIGENTFFLVRMLPLQLSRKQYPILIFSAIESLT